MATERSRPRIPTLRQNVALGAARSHLVLPVRFGCDVVAQSARVESAEVTAYQPAVSIPKGTGRVPTHGKKEARNNDLRPNASSPQPPLEGIDVSISIVREHVLQRTNSYRRARVRIPPPPSRPRSKQRVLSALLQEPTPTLLSVLRDILNAAAVVVVHESLPFPRHLNIVASCQATLALACPAPDVRRGCCKPAHPRALD